MSINTLHVGTGRVPSACLQGRPGFVWKDRNFHRQCTNAKLKWFSRQPNLRWSSYFSPSTQTAEHLSMFRRLYHKYKSHRAKYEGLSFVHSSHGIYGILGRKVNYLLRSSRVHCRQTWRVREFQYNTSASDVIHILPFRIQVIWSWLRGWTE